MGILNKLVERLTGKGHADMNQLADDLFSEEGRKRSDREQKERAEMIRRIWERPKLQELAKEIGLTEAHLHDVYRRIMLHGDYRMSQRAIENVELLRWYLEHGGKDKTLGPDAAIQLFLFARDGRPE